MRMPQAMRDTIKPGLNKAVRQRHLASGAIMQGHNYGKPGVCHTTPSAKLLETSLMP